MKKGNNAFCYGAAALPKILAVILFLTMVIGAASVYSKGKTVANSLNINFSQSLIGQEDIISTRKRMSRDFNSEGERILADKVFCGSIVTRDQVTLWGPLIEEDDLGAAWCSLIGNINNTTDSENFTRYIIDNYKKELFPDISYSLTGGLEAEKRNIELTLDCDLQESMYQFYTDRGISGSLTAYDYESGEVMCLVSTPGAVWNDKNHSSDAYFNKCLSNTTPGSTMKLILLYLLEDQGIDPESLYFTCDHAYELKADHEIVNCMGRHGNINGVTAIGVSCNTYFAQAIELLDLERAAETLRKMGFQINDSTCYTDIGNLPRSYSYVMLNENADFNTVMQLIGEDSGCVSPLDMVRIVGYLATNGQAVDPKIELSDETITSEYAKDTADIWSDTANVWRKGFDEYYEGYSITAGKTGTASDLGTDASRTQRMFAGYSEETQMAFYIVVENYNSIDTRLDEIVNYFMEQVCRKEE